MLAPEELAFVEELIYKKNAGTQNKSEYVKQLLEPYDEDELERWSQKTKAYQRSLNFDPNKEEPYDIALHEVRKMLQNEINRRKIERLGLKYTHGEPAEMSGAELASMLKSSVRFKSTDGIKCDELKLPAEDMAWWHDAKLGMFIHWGAYSIIGRGEWVMHQGKIPADEYREIAMQFNPQHFDANNWAQLAKDAGMNYMVMVTKHHDGFALWDSKGSHEGFTTMNAAAKRDFVKEYTEAARAHGLRAGVYYSPMDWRFPGYFDPVEKYENALLMKKQCYDQVGELIGDYGPIDILWYDGSWLGHRGSDAGGAWLWEPIDLNKMARSHNPKLIINERSGWEGDFSCNEGPHDVEGNIIPFPWEKNFSVAGSWAWRPENTAMEYEHVMNLLINTFVRNGNALLNVAPDKDGVVPEDQVQLFKKIGEFMKANGESIYGTRGGPFQPVDHVYGATYRGNTVYLHILDTEAFNKLKLPALQQRVTACSTLSGEPLSFTQDDNGISVTVPDAHRKPIDTIVKLTLDSEVTGVLPAE